MLDYKNVHVHGFLGLIPGSKICRWSCKHKSSTHRPAINNIKLFLSQMGCRSAKKSCSFCANLQPVIGGFAGRCAMEGKKMKRKNKKEINNGSILWAGMSFAETEPWGVWSASAVHQATSSLPPLREKNSISQQHWQILRWSVLFFSMHVHARGFLIMVQLLFPHK